MYLRASLLALPFSNYEANSIHIKHSAFYYIMYSTNTNLLTPMYALRVQSTGRGHLNGNHSNHRSKRIWLGNLYPAELWSTPARPLSSILH